MERSDLEINGVETGWDGWNDPPHNLVLSEEYSQRAMDDAANKAKTRTISEDVVKDLSGTLPMPQLVRQLLKNCHQQSLSALRNIDSWIVEESPRVAASDPGLHLLLQYQRLLLARVYAEKNTCNSNAVCLLSKYLFWLGGHVMDLVETCIHLLDEPQTNNFVVGAIVTMLRTSILGKLITNDIFIFLRGSF